MQHVINGYALTLSSQVKAVSIAKVLEEQLEHWVKVADHAIFKEFSRYGEARELVGDVWLSISTKERNANVEAFADTKEDAERMLGRIVRMYAKNSRYVPGITELAKIKSANKDMDVTVCSFSAIADSLETSENDIDMSIEAVYMQQFGTKWDMLTSDGQLSLNQTLDLIKQLAQLLEVATPEERINVITMAQSELELGPDSPQEVKDAFYAMVRNNFRL